MPLGMRTLLAALLVSGCGGADLPPPAPARLDPVPSLREETGTSEVTLSVIGTSDLHGHIERLPLFASYLAAIRAARADDGGVILVDAGDMWQGTLASNLAEGAPVVSAYGALRYDAAAIGNHEFDYGPTGPSATPVQPGEERRSALLARASEAQFPILAANLRVRETGEPIAWPNVQPSVLVERAGLKIGIIGVTTAGTLETTIAANVDDLLVAPLAESIAEQAESLRAHGANAIVVAAHAGGDCTETSDPTDLTSCDDEAEIFAVARALPAGLVDVIVSGHTHKQVAHEVAGVAVVGSWALGRAFGRVDLTFEGGRLVSRRIHPPRDLCAEAPPAACEPGSYEGVAIAPSADMEQRIAPALEAANERLQERLGPTLAESLPRDYSDESAAGNMLSDLVAASVDGEDAVLLNSGGVRADFPAGPLTYGALYEAFPFDNRMARVRLSAQQLAAILERNAFTDGGALLVSGIRAVGSCNAGSLTFVLKDARGRTLPPRRMLDLATSDYLATTSLFDALPEGAVTIEDGTPMRERLADALRQPGTQVGDAASYYDPAHPRVTFPMPRPVRCPR